jgi:hypothetical protein
MSIWDKLAEFPPVLVRLIAKDGRQAMTDVEIVASSLGKLSLADVRKLSLLTTWDQVTIRETRAFLIACNVNLADRSSWRNTHRYVKNARFQHLRQHREWPWFRELLAVYAEHLTHGKRT